MAGLTENRNNELIKQEPQNSDSRESLSLEELIPNSNELDLKEDSLPDDSCDPKDSKIIIGFNPPRSREGLLVSKVPSILNDPVLEKAVQEYEALSPEAKRIFDLTVDRLIRKRHRKQSLQDKPVDLFFAIRSKNPNHYDFQAYLAGITKTLEREGLWKEELSETLESDLFSPTAEKDIDLDYKLSPKLLTSIYTKKNKGFFAQENLNQSELGLEWQENDSIEYSDWPSRAEVLSHNLMRRSPWNIEEKIARLMIESHFFDLNPDLEKLFPCAFFFSKSIFERVLFIKIKYEAFTGTPFQKKFRTYSFKRYKEDQKELQRVIGEILKKWFFKNSSITSAVREFANKNNLDDKKLNTILRSIWSKFLDINKKLTPKQEKAMEAVYLEVPSLTFSEAALREGISRDSFQDRINGATKKFKDALPELLLLKKNEEIKISHALELLYNGFYRKNLAARIHRLFRINPETNERLEIIPRQGLPKPNKNFVNPTLIHAWSIVSTPIPDITETDYFTGLYPEGLIHRKKGRK